MLLFYAIFYPIILKFDNNMGHFYVKSKATGNGGFIN